MADNRLILTFDSGLGGLTVYSELTALLPDISSIYLADDAAFPYGRLAEADVVARVRSVLDSALQRSSPDVVVIACNTASTVVLPHLRARFSHIDFVGTVPAIKPAAEQSKTGMITVLGTSGTVQRDYTRVLIADHAAHCDVTLVGSETLAGLAERYAHTMDICGEDFDNLLVRELEPCFVEKDGARTDQIVLACTHYPLLRQKFEALAGTRVGWPVQFVDPAPAIAKRAAHVLNARAPRPDSVQQPIKAQVWTTSGQVDDASRTLFAKYGLTFTPGFAVPFEDR